MDKSDLRAIVFDILRKTPQTHFRAVENDVRSASETYERRDVLLLNEVLWDLLLQGVLAPGKNSLNPDLPFVHVTEYGIQCLEHDTWVAHDPDRYIERLIDGGCGLLPEAVANGARLALRAFLDGRYDASIVLLAHAAEHVLRDLTDELIRKGRRDGRGTKRLEAKRESLGGLAEAVRHAIDARRPPVDLGDHDEAVSGLGGLIRTARSRDGRPRIPSIDRDQALARFLAFLDQCRFAYHAIAWLRRGTG
jgi:hypothetical protein